MIVTNDMLKMEYKKYSNINNKISRDIRDKKLFKVKVGIYETDPNVEPKYLAPVIYGPSYISFEYALSVYGLIPERVYAITNATFKKRKRKSYENYFGRYLYRDVPPKAFPLEKKLVVENGYSYIIATPEKALCDKLYTLKPIKSLKEMQYVLFDNLRIYEDEFEKLDIYKIEQLSMYYNSKNVTLFAKYIRRYFNE